MKAGRRAIEGRGQLVELVRYGVVVVFGLGIDLGLGISLRWLLGWPLALCGAAGFGAGVAANYVLCEIWVFAPARLSLRRLGQAYLAASAALAIRIAAIWILAAVWHGEQAAADLAKLAIAAGLSFLVNFLMLRRYLRT